MIEWSILFVRKLNDFSIQFCVSRSGVSRHNYSIDLGKYDKAVCCVISAAKVGMYLSQVITTQGNSKFNSN